MISYSIIILSWFNDLFISAACLRPIFRYYYSYSYSHVDGDSYYYSNDDYYDDDDASYDVYSLLTKTSTSIPIYLFPSKYYSHIFISTHLIHSTTDETNLFIIFIPHSFHNLSNYLILTSAI